MTRHYIGYTHRGETVFRNIGQDEDNLPVLLFAENERRRIELDLSPMLDSGETISTATTSGSGITASITNTTTKVTLTLSAPTPWGEITTTITLSTGDIITSTIRARVRSKQASQAAYSL